MSSVENFVKELGSVVEEDEQLTKNWMKILTSSKESYNLKCSGNLTDEKKLKDVQSKNELEELCNAGKLENVEKRSNDFNKTIQELKTKQSKLQQKLVQLETERDRINSNPDHVVQLEKLESLKTVYKCYENLFPVVFDYSNKNLFGYVSNKETARCYCFDVPLESATANIPEEWEKLEKLFEK